MTKNQDIGKAAEDYVSEQLKKRGAVIIARNYTVHGVGEIDIICAYKGRVLVIEVKSRHYDMNYGTPEEAVTKSKQRKIMQTAVCFCNERNIPLDRVSYYVAGVLHDSYGNILEVQYTPFFG